MLIIALMMSSTAISQNLESKVDRLYEAGAGEPGFSIAVFKGDEIVLEKQYGTANLDYGVPINSETAFDIGSIGKQFTAAAILLLEKDGKLSIDEPAYKYVDKLPRYKEGDPTIKQLLNQTSGIKEVDPYLNVVDLSWYDLLTQSRMMNIILHVNELNFKPGEYFQYTNANYILLAHIVEEVSGEPFADYLEGHIFSPLGMDHTVKKTTTYLTVKNRAMGYLEQDGEYYRTHQHSAIFNGDGQILTTPRDIFKWHQGIRNATIGTPDLWEKMHTKGTLNDGTTINFGLGVEFEVHNGYEAMGFDGMIIGGFVSKYLYFPELDIAFFTTQNTFEGDFRERFFKLVDLYVPKKQGSGDGDEKAAYEEVPLSKEELQKYEGNYVFFGNEQVDLKTNVLKVKGRKLVAFTTDGDEIATLKSIGNDQFLWDNNTLVSFALEADGNQFGYHDEENEAPWLFRQYQPYTHSESELKELEGSYFNQEFQNIKRLKLEEGVLVYYCGNGAWKYEASSISRDLLEIYPCPLEIVRSSENEVTGFKMMGILFEKM